MSANIFIYFYVCFVDGGARTSTNSLTLSTQERVRERGVHLYKIFLGIIKCKITNIQGQFNIKEKFI